MSSDPMSFMFLVMAILVAVVAIIVAAFAVFVGSGLVAVLAIVVVGVLRNTRPAWRWLPVIWLALAVLFGLTAVGIVAYRVTQMP